MIRIHQVTGRRTDDLLTKYPAVIIIILGNNFSNVVVSDVIQL